MLEMKPILPLFLLALALASCGSPTPKPTPTVATETALPVPSLTETLPPSATPPPTLTSTPVLFAGTLSTRLNVRSGPGTSYDSLGLLNAGETVQVVFQSGDGKWYQILYPSAAQGRAWVAAQFVTLAAGAQVPLEGQAQGTTSNGSSGRVTQKLNVRSGPGTSFDALGTLEPESVVALTGKDSTASWFQIEYSSGPGGRGWITAQYVQTEDTARLPVLDEYGNPVPGMQGDTSVPMTLTPTVGPALADEDSPSNPAVRVTFSAGGTRQLTYSSQVSAPDGDTEDWIEFTPYAASVTFSLSCSGNGTLQVELWQGGSLLTGWGSLSCGDQAKVVSLTAGLPYQVRLTPVAGTTLQLIQYQITVRNGP